METTIVLARFLPSAVSVLRRAVVSRHRLPVQIWQRVWPMTCPKCGSEAGWHGPTYKPGEYYMGNRRSEVGRLAYACNTCGYERLERTLNQIEVADPVWPDTPPPPLPGIDPGIDLSPAPRWLTAGWWRELNTWLFR